jgi:hypothetical protein
LKKWYLEQINSEAEKAVTTVAARRQVEALESVAAEETPASTSTKS